RDAADTDVRSARAEIRALAARARNRHRGDRRLQQPRDRAALLPQPGDGQAPPDEDLRQTESLQSSRARAVRDQRTSGGAVVPPATFVSLSDHFSSPPSPACTQNAK